MIDNFGSGFSVTNQIQTPSSKHVHNDNAYKCYNYPIMNWSFVNFEDWHVQTFKGC